MNLSFQKFQELIKKGYSPDILHILEFVSKGVDITSDSKKVENIVLTTIRKGLITEDYKITVEGQNILDFIGLEVEEPILKKVIKGDDDFLLWWNIFPGTDTFEYKGKKFIGSRSLRTKKYDCKAKIKTILNEGEYTITDIVEATKLDILQKKEASLKTGTNKLSYLQNSMTYLNQNSWEPFVELYKQGIKVDESKKISTGVDI